MSLRAVRVAQFLLALPLTISALATLQRVSSFRDYCVGVDIAAYDSSFLCADRVVVKSYALVQVTIDHI